jgi:hypothetical protein
MRGFYAFPASPSHIGQVIASGPERLGKSSGLEVNTWEENDISGYPLLTPILPAYARHIDLRLDVIPGDPTAARPVPAAHLA